MPLYHFRIQGRKSIMDQRKIKKCNRITLTFFIILPTCALLLDNHINEKNQHIFMIFFLVLLFIGVFIPSHIAIKASKCPSCKKYLTIKKNWIGKYCEHCGDEVKEKEYDVGLQNEANFKL